MALKSLFLISVNFALIWLLGRIVEWSPHCFLHGVEFRIVLILEKGVYLHISQLHKNEMNTNDLPISYSTLTVSTHNSNTELQILAHFMGSVVDMKSGIGKLILG